MFRGGTSLRMAWHDRQNRETTACRMAGSRLRLQSLAWGPAERKAQCRVSAGESKTGCRDLYHWIRVRVGRSAQPASELAVRRLQMLDDVAQALCHGHRLASRFLPTVGDERASLGLERCTGAPLHRWNHWTAFLQWLRRAGPGSCREAGTAAGTARCDQPTCFASSPRPLVGQGGDIAKITCNLCWS